MTESVIRSIVFDIGGVLVTSPLGPFAEVDEEFGLRPGTTMDLFRGGSIFAECETGRMPFAEFCATAVAGIRAEQGIALPPERLGTMMDAIMGDTVDESMRDFVISLKAQGLQVGLLSNIYAELDWWMHSVFPPGTVDVYCPSYAVGLRKPDPAIYAALIERCAVPAAEIVFVDDFPENVGGAAAAGLRAIHFTGEDALRKELRELGVPA